MRDHGGNIDWAIQRFGGSRDEWIDLSTGINRCPYPLPAQPPECWQALPTKSALASLHQAAQQTYKANGHILATAGAQAAIQMIPHLRALGHARVLAPTYNEHAATLRAAGWHVTEVEQLHDLRGADLAVVVNPNNPDGRRHDQNALIDILESVGHLVVDESFADADPQISIAPLAGRNGLLVLRSIGKFYGLAGLRLGFILGTDSDIGKLAEMAGPWPVSGPAIHIGRCALLDVDWAETTTARLKQDAHRLDDLAARSGWKRVGGTALFRLYETDCAQTSQERLARSYVWSRIFPWSKQRIRLGLPGPDAEWARLSLAFKGVA